MTDYGSTYSITLNLNYSREFSEFVYYGTFYIDYNIYKIGTICIVFMWNIFKEVWTGHFYFLTRRVESGKLD